MQNFTELLNNTLVNPIKQRLASLNQANKENADSFKTLEQNLAATNEQQKKIDSSLQELTKQVQNEVGRLDKIEQEFKISQETQSALIAALEELKWDDDGDEVVITTEKVE